MSKITSTIFLRVIVQYLTVHCYSYFKFLVVFLFFHKLFSTLNHLNLWNGFHTIYFKIFRSLEYIGVGGEGFVCIDISSCYQNLAALMLIFTFLSTLLKYMVVAALCTVDTSVRCSIEKTSFNRKTPSLVYPGNLVNLYSFKLFLLNIRYLYQKLTLCCFSSLE